MPHPDRRQFLSLLAAAGTAALGRPTRGDAAVAVAAEATPFFAHPDGQRCLVRFFVSNLDAPAGRLRAFDHSRRQLGTAGVVPLGDGRLYGELWLPLGALPRIRTELAAPGLSPPLATWHALTPAPRWTIHWITLLDPERLQQHLASLDRIPRAVETATLRRVGAMVNPVPARLPTAIGDMTFWRAAEPGRRVAALVGVAPGPVAAVAGADLRVPTLASVLAASGVETVVLLDAPASGLHWRHGPDGSRLLVAAASAGANPETLGFEEGGDRMVRSVERLLLTAGAADAKAVTLVVGTNTDRLAQAAAVVRDWNARFAYPRIVVGDAEAFLRTAAQSFANRIPPWVPEAPVERAAPSLAEANDAAADRSAESHRRAAAMIACLARLLPGGGAGLEKIANQLALPVPGTLVFNPTSYARTELARMADGSERVVTDIPPLGYAYFPLGQGEGGGWRAMEEDGSPLTIQTLQFRVALDPDTGAIRSMVSRADGTEWAQEPLGLNAIADARLEGSMRETLPGVGARISAERRTPLGGVIRTVVTTYERVPWIDIVNHAEAPGDEAVAYRFAFGLHGAGVEWEIPAGVERATPPCDCAHLRWLRLTGERGTALFAARQSAAARMDEGGTLSSYGPPGESRYRIRVSGAGAFAFPEDPWRFGWGIEPSVTAPVPGTGGATLPTFGTLLVLDQPGVAVVGMQPAGDGNGVIVYLQELSGRTRVATLGAGLIGFADARLVDLVERDLGAPAMVMRNGLGVMLAGHGVAAVRLLGVTLARA